MSDVPHVIGSTGGGGSAPPPLPRSPLPDTVVRADLPSLPDAEATAPPSVASPAGGRPFGRYRLLEELGHGGMGVVWRAWDERLGREVALKQVLCGADLDRERTERLLREARLAAKLHHPNIIAVLDVGEHEGQPYLTTEYVKGDPLDVVMRKAVGRTQALGWVRQVADALAYAHGQGVIHRDVKPANLLLDAEGRLHVMDFGLAREAERGTGSEPTLTVTGAILGTPAYMSPEQASGQTERAGPASDQFSLGIVLYELITGRRPFDGASLQALLDAIAREDPVPPSRIDRGVPRDLDAVCLKALEKDPARRYRSLGALGVDLDRLLAGEPTSARPVPLVSRLLRKAVRHRSVVLPTAAALAVAIGFAAYVVVSRVNRAQEAEAEALRTARLSEEKLRAEQRERETLEKAYRVSKVLTRWRRLGATLGTLQEGRYDRRVSAEEFKAHVAEAWPRVEAFLEETSRDAASQATARAFAGLAKWFVGEEEAGVAWMREAAAADPDVPFGCLMEALVHLSESIDGMDMPDIRHTEDRVEFEPETEQPPVVEEAAREAEALLARAARARLWGQEGCEDFAAALAGMRALLRGEFATADEHLSIAIASPNLEAFAAELALNRAKARMYRKRFDEALADLARICEALPGYAHPRFIMGMVKSVRARDRGRRRPEYGAEIEGAIRDLTEAIDLAPGYVLATLNRSALYIDLGRDEASRGLDPRERFGRAVVDCDAILEGGGGSPEVIGFRADALYALAVAEDDRGGDAREVYERAIADLAASAEGSCAAVRIECLADVHIRLGGLNDEAGKESTSCYERAIEACDRSLALTPENASVRYRRGDARRRIADAARKRGGDATRGYEEALADFEETIMRDPMHRLAWSGVGAACMGLGRPAASVAAYEVQLDVGGDAYPASKEWLAQVRDKAAAKGVREWEVEVARAAVSALRGDWTSARARLAAARGMDGFDAGRIAPGAGLPALAADPNWKEIVER